MWLLEAAATFWNTLASKKEAPNIWCLLLYYQFARFLAVSCWFWKAIWANDSDEKNCCIQISMQNSKMESPIYKTSHFVALALLFSTTHHTRSKMQRVGFERFTVKSVFAHCITKSTNDKKKTFWATLVVDAIQSLLVYFSSFVRFKLPLTCQTVICPLTFSSHENCSQPEAPLRQNDHQHNRPRK